MGLRKYLLLGAKFALSGLLIWYFLSKTDLEAAFATAREISLGSFILAVTVILLPLPMAAWRWRFILSKVDHALRFSDLMKTTFIGNFLNTTLVSTVGGDAYRLWVLVKSDIPLGRAVNSIFLDRLAGLTGLLLIVIACQPVLISLMGDNPARWGFFPVFLAALGGFAALVSADRLPHFLMEFRFLRWLGALAADSRSLFLNPRNAMTILGLSVFIHMIIIAAVTILSRGLGMELSYLTMLTLIPPVTLAMMLPISIAGWGVREAAMIAALSLVGVPQETALVLSILFGLAMTAAALPGGLIWLFSKNRVMPSEIPQ